MIKYDSNYWDDVRRVIHCVPEIKKIYNKSFLITGATGMICSSVAELLFLLNKEYDANISITLAGRGEARAKERFAEFEFNKEYKYLRYDAAKNVNMEFKADYVIHGASNAHPALYTKEPVETMLANFIGLNSLLEASVKNQIQRLLFISSSEVYGQKMSRNPYSEEDDGVLDILNPRASYPSVKRAAETLCVAYGQEYNLDTVIVRPGHIYGPSITSSDSRASAQFSRNAVKGENIVLKSAGTQLRSYCYTLDCASAILAVLINGERGNAYNISNKDSIVSIADLAKTLAKIRGTDVVFETASGAEQKGYNLMDNSSLTSDKLEALGWKALFSLQEGCERTIRHLALES